MLGIVAIGALGGAAALAEPSPRVVIDLMPKRCSEGAADADVVVCAGRERPYRIDPGVLAGERAREALPSDTRTAQEKAVEGSCYDGPAKCQGGGVIPVLPAALKTIEAAALAVKGDDWRQPFRTKPDAYQAYRAEQERQRAKVGVSAGAGASTGAPPR